MKSVTKKEEKSLSRKSYGSILTSLPNNERECFPRNDENMLSNSKNDQFDDVKVYSFVMIYYI